MIGDIKVIEVPFRVRKFLTKFLGTPSHCQIILNASSYPLSLITNIPHHRTWTNRQYGEPLVGHENMTKSSHPKYPDPTKLAILEDPSKKKKVHSPFHYRVQSLIFRAMKFPPHVDLVGGSFPQVGIKIKNI